VNEVWLSTNKRAKIILEISILLLSLDTLVEALHQAILKEYLLIIKIHAVYYE